jgi:hypothetical protein
VKKDNPWWKDGLNGVVGFGKGVIIDGGWGLVKGVGYMAGFGPKDWDWHNVWNSYKAIETLGAPLSLPGAFALPSVRKTWANTGKDFIALDEWKKDKGRAAGKVVFNIVTLGIPATRLGMAGKAGDAALAITRGVNKVDVVGHGLNLGVRVGVKGTTAGLDAIKNLHVGEGLTHLPKIHVNGLNRLTEPITPKADPPHFELKNPNVSAPHSPSAVHETPHAKPTVRQLTDHVASKFEHDAHHIDPLKHEPASVGSHGTAGNSGHDNPPPSDNNGPSNKGENKTPGLIRQDDKFHSEYNSKNQRKSHLNAEGDLVPANPEGNATVVDHIVGRDPAKSDSPFTSLSAEGANAKAFGSNRIRVDLEHLQADIASGKLQGVDAYSPERVQGLIQENANKIAGKHVDLTIPPGSTKAQAEEYSRALGLSNSKAKRIAQRMIDMMNTRRDQEWLIRGTVPSKYIEGPFGG